MGYAKTEKDVVSITPKGKAKLKTFQAGLRDEDRQLFEKYAK
jgi:DNA-binding MarR family transcriptional regulator